MKCAKCGMIGQIQKQWDGELQCLTCGHVVGALVPVLDTRPILVCPFPGSCDFATRETEGPKSLSHHVEAKHGRPYIPREASAHQKRMLGTLYERESVGYAELGRALKDR